MRLAPYSKSERFRLPSRLEVWRQASVLLEVLVALALFVAAAAIIGTGLSASLNSVERLRLTTRAADLAVSVLSELQMGIKSTALTGSQPFPSPFQDWTWEISTTPLDLEATQASPFTKVEVVVRHDAPEMTYRLSQIVRLGEAKSISEADASIDNEAF